MTECTTPDGHAWVGELSKTLDNFETNSDTVLVDAQCEFCDEKRRLELECRNPDELNERLQDWENKEQQSTNDIHAVLPEVTYAEFKHGYPYAEVQIAVYYEGQHDPDYPDGTKYQFEV